MLVRLLEAGTRDEFEPSILSLMDPDSCPGVILAAQAAALRVPIFTLGLAQGDWRVAALWRLGRILRTASPELLQGWMYHGNLTATIGSWLMPRRPPVLWNVRHSLHDLALEKPLTRLILRLSSRLSRLPQAIIYNSRISAAQHARLGFDASRAVVIPNGFDGTHFRPQPEAGARLRRDLGIDPARTVIGLIARDHPMKDPGNLIRAVALLQARGRAVHLVIIGRRLDASNQELGALVRESGIDAHVSLQANAPISRRWSPASMSPRSVPPGAKASPTSWARRWPAASRASRPTSATAAGSSGRTASSCHRARARPWRTPSPG